MSPSDRTPVTPSPITSALTRYEQLPYARNCSCSLEPDARGDWVRVEDLAASLAAVRARVQHLTEHIGGLEDGLGETTRKVQMMCLDVDADLAALLLPPAERA